MISIIRASQKNIYSTTKKTDTVHKKLSLARGKYRVKKIQGLQYRKSNGACFTYE
jgi:hypothetical protein